MEKGKKICKLMVNTFEKMNIHIIGYIILHYYTQINNYYYEMLTIKLKNKKCMFDPIAVGNRIFLKINSD